MKLDNLKIRTLLRVGFATVLAVMVLLAGIGIGHMNKANTLTRKLAGESFHCASMLQEWQSIIEVNAARTLAVIQVADPADEKFFLDSIVETSKRSDVLRKEIQASFAGDLAALALFDAVDKERDAYRAARKIALEKKAAGDTEAVRSFLNAEMIPRIQSYIKALHAMLEHQQQAVATDVRRVDDESWTSLRQ